MTGTLPSELGRLTQLFILQLFENLMTGTLPSELGMLSNITDLILDLNQFTGSVPTELGLLLDLWSFSIVGTNITGSLDNIFCNRSSQVMDLYADCLGDPPEVECSCCNYCY